MKKLGSVFMFFIIFSFHSCRDSTTKVEEDDFEEGVTIEEIKDLERVKQVFYALPSPVEIASLLNSSGAVFDGDLLNPVENSGNYLTTKSMALNLGVYITDLSYAGFFDQTQVSITYMAVSKELAERLGIMDAVDGQTLERLEANLNNREIVMDIISETYLSSSAILKEDERESVAAMLFAGGLVEGLYIASSLVDANNVKGNELVRHLIDQKYSVELLMKILEMNKNNEDVEDIYSQVSRISEIYKTFEVPSSATPVPAGRGEKGAVTDTTGESVITQRQFQDLKEIIETVRYNFVSSV